MAKTQAGTATNQDVAELLKITPEQAYNLLMFRELESDFWESIFYADASKNYTAYYTQGIERDAREYAEKRVKVYERLVEFADGEYNGIGKMTCADGTVVKGLWQKGFFVYAERDGE